MNRRSLVTVLAGALASVGIGRFAIGASSTFRDLRTQSSEFNRILALLRDINVPYEITDDGEYRVIAHLQPGHDAFAVLRQWKYIEGQEPRIYLHPTDTFTDWNSPAYIEWDRSRATDPVRAVHPGTGYRPSSQIVGFSDTYVVEAA